MEQTTPPAPYSAHLWSLSDGRAGNVRQASALAHALRTPSLSEWQLQTSAPWRWLAPRRWPGSVDAFGSQFANALAQPPTLAVGCGRQAALATRVLREHGSQVVQILDPRLEPAYWDWLVVPRHDGIEGDNVLQMQGSLNPVDDAWLALGRASFAELGQLPRPRTAVLLGGNSAHARFDRGAFEVLAAKLEVALARDGGSVMITTSRRTPDKVIRPLRDRYVETPGVVWCGDADGANPYAGMLAWADRIVCTPDSVNMVSEACATRVPVHVFDPHRVRGRPRRFLDSLLASGRIQVMDSTLADFEVTPLRETARIAALLRERLPLA
ncbi:mitochondrial fission ELM1 family protein [Pseudoxanthomonas dokdonensis]|uniref:Nucleoside-diphosphate sugar epimerase n=1 Tax=Pseudoxanthomonas dokdonensis TaxID=344882 RepID=A0A0R0CHJ6_9GAMM|nr:mitochondrial fission ELM1 family protein [Pseudoxanthomonas dokdonensis]KRG68614.1 nucleoside-diphosphate sugar epimerase [Pseudoxanthomonas dokdonensis]